MNAPLRNLWLRLLAIAIVWGYNAPHARASEPLKLSALEDTTARLTLAEVAARPAAFRPVLTSVPNYGFTRSAIWFRFTAANPNHSREKLYVSVPHAKIDHLALFVQGTSGRLQTVITGDRLSSQARPYQASSLILPFTLEGGESATVYLQAVSEASAMIVPIELLNEREIDAANHLDSLIHGAIFGVFAALFLYNLFLCLSIRSYSYLYYVLYLLVAYLAVTSLNGFGSSTLYPTLICRATKV